MFFICACNIFLAKRYIVFVMLIMFNYMIERKIMLIIILFNYIIFINIILFIINLV